jgi:4-amino-4-deoxy-L-arabinose transferase-like glycosyltransferase
VLLIEHLRRRLSHRQDFFWMLAIGLLGLALRLLYATQYASHPLGQLLWVDEIVYWERGVDILQGHWMPDRPFFQDPLIHFLLAGLMTLVGQEVSTLRIALAVIGSLTPMFTYAAGRRGLGRPEAILAGFALAFYGPLVFTDAELEKEGPGALFVALAFLAVAVASAPQRKPAVAGLAGLLWGLVSLLRANALLVAPIGFLWWLIAPEQPGNRRRLGACCFLAGFALAIAPVTIVNAVVSRPHEFILTTWQGGAMFYTGNGPEASGVGEPPFIRHDPHVEADDFAAEAERRAGRRLSPGEVSSFWMREGLRQWREAPLASLRFLGFKLGLLLNNVEVPDSQSPDWVRLAAAPGLSLAFLGFGCLIPFAAVGLTRRDRTPFWWFLSAVTVPGLVSIACFYVVGRYRVPWSPGVALLAAAGLVELWRAFRAHEWRAMAWKLVLVAAPVAFLAWRPEVDPDPDRWGYYQFAIVVAYLQAGDLDAAIDGLDDARAAQPRSEASTVLNGPGALHDQWKTAVGRAWEAAPKDPSSLLTLARLARVVPETHAMGGRLLDELASKQPDNPALWRERGGWWLARQPEDSESRQKAIEAFRRASGDPSARICLALLTSDLSLLNEETASRPDRVRLARAVIQARQGSRGRHSSAPARRPGRPATP